ncbi:MAG: cysteine hydrolase family protein [Pantoea sp.]|uniref:cysteine hydrolase family protein n=1 Tax=Pantoea sp. TaxID=69393 RepID=UPI00239F186E|nr:cysteine hydrolase family protein [Pantoea sp.]MDE1187110.1 cysteine hydrolase family protein [Pantoea sp.]
MSNEALIIIDLQNDYFPGGKLPLVGIEAATANAAKVIAAARASRIPVIHVQHHAVKPDAPFFVPGTPGVQIHASVKPEEGESVVTKNYTNSFRATSLGNLLGDKGIREVTIAGAMSHMCIDAATRAAADLGFSVTVLHDACATRDLHFEDRVVAAADVHAAYMAALAASYASVVSTDSWLAR